MKSNSKLMQALTLTLTLATFSTVLEADSEASIRQALTKVLPGDLTYDLKPAPIQGLYSVMIGPQVLYVTNDGRYLMEGNVFDLQTHVNITDNLKREARIASLASVQEADTLTFKSAQLDAETVTVFSDVDCAYCRQFHKEMADYHARGINIRYLFFPRDGKNSDTYQKMQNIWCNENPREAWTAAIAGKSVTTAACANPIDRHIALGRLMEIRGTPAIILPSGEHVAGYLSADKLRAKIDGKAQ